MSNVVLNGDTVISRHAGVEFTGFDDEIVMVDIERGGMYGLDRVASDIWEMLEEPMAVGRLFEILCEKYQISSELCREDTLPFLEKMAEFGVIDTDSEG